MSETLIPDRLEGESTQAHAAMVAYLQLGPGRSLGKVSEIISKNSRRTDGGKGGERGVKRGRATSRIYRWSAEHEWTERAREFDRRQAEELAQAQRAAEVEFAKKNAQKWAKRREECLEIAFVAGSCLYTEVHKIITVGRTLPPINEGDAPITGPLDAAELRKLASIFLAANQLLRSAVESGTRERLEPPATAPVLAGESHPAPRFIEIGSAASRNDLSAENERQQSPPTPSIVPARPPVQDVKLATRDRKISIL